MKINKVKKILFSLFILAIPFDNYNIFSQFSASDIFLIFLLLFLLINFLLLKVKFEWNNINTLLMLLLFWFILSFFSSENLDISLRTLITSVMIFLVLFITIYYSNSSKALKSTYWIIIIAGIISATTGIIQWIAYKKLGIILWDPVLYYSDLTNSIVFRVTGSYYDPNFYTLYLIIPMILSLMIIVEKKFFTHRERIYAFFSLMMIMIPYILSFSRAGWVVLAVFSFCFVFRRLKITGRIFLFSSVVIVLITGVVSKLFYNILHFNYESTMQRFTVAVYSLRTIFSHPINGIGLGVRIFNPYTGYRMETHNTFLQVGTYAGLFALIVFVTIIFYIFYYGIQTYKILKGTKDGVILEGYIWAFSSCVLGMLTLNGLFLKHFWIVGGLIVSSYLMIKKGKYEIEKFNK